MNKGEKEIDGERVGEREGVSGRKRERNSDALHAYFGERERDRERASERQKEHARAREILGERGRAEKERRGRVW